MSFLVIFAEFRVSYCHPIGFLTSGYILLPKQLEGDTNALQLFVDLLIVGQGIQYFGLIPLRKELPINFLIRQRSDISVTYFEFIRSLEHLTY